MSQAPGDVRVGSRWLEIARNVILPVGLLAVILGGLWWWDNRDSGGINDAYGAVELPADKNPTDQSPAPQEGRAGPDFILERPEGGTLRLSDYQGSPVILNFWASWCEPCRSEMPEFVTAYAQHQADGLEIVAVNLQEPDQQILDFAQEFGITFPIAIDRDGELRNIWRLGGPFDGIPTTYFLDASGVVRDMVYGPLTQGSLEKRIDALLGGSG